MHYVCEDYSCVYKACNPGDACYYEPDCEPDDLECLCKTETFL